MKLIDVSTPTHPNKFAQVDDSDFDFLNQWKWSATEDCGNFYARRREGGGREKARYYKMHRVIADAKAGDTVDHWDGKGLNNQRHNLRMCTPGQNRMNSRKRRDTGSKFKGVSPDGDGFRAYIMTPDRGRVHLGMFAVEIEAAVAYNAAAVAAFGEFARLNVITVEAGL